MIHVPDKEDNITLDLEIIKIQLLAVFKLRNMKVENHEDRFTTYPIICDMSVKTNLTSYAEINKKKL